MSGCDISDSVRIQDGVAVCARCGSTPRVGRGFCLNCMLKRALGNDIETSETLQEVLDEIDVRDADWRIGNYQILEEIGRGGMGVIYRARQRHSRRIVALKRILSYQAESQETLVRFRREAEAAASLDHPNILPIYEVSESEDGLPFFSMKFAAGGSLLDAARSLRDNPRRIIALMAKVTRAVQYAHLQGILHRDLKPGNILLDGRSEPLVSDFGLAKWLDTSSDLTRTLTIFGTPGYIAPEQAHAAAKNLTPAADIYSIGAVLFDLFTGRTPFLGEHALAVIKQASEKPPPKLRTLAPLADRDIETICAKCLEREPHARYRSAGELAEDFERWLEGRPIIARPVSPPVRIWRWSKRNRVLASSIAGCIVLGAAAAAFESQSRAREHATAISLHSVAVHPFLDLDSARYDPVVANAVAQALRHELTRHGPARITAELKSESAADVTAVGSNGVRTWLQGTERVRNGTLRLSIRLLNATDGNVLYRRIIETDASEGRIERVANSIGAEIYRILDQSNLASAELVDRDPIWHNATARELFLAGRSVMEQRSSSDFVRAVELFQKSIGAEPQSALAQSYLAEAEYGMGFLNGEEKHLIAAAKVATKAIELNPDRAETRKAMSGVLFHRGHFRESLEEAFTAYELADTSSVGNLARYVADNLRELGDPVRAVAWYRMTHADRPGRNDFMVADCLADLTDDQRAAAVYHRVSTLWPELPEGWMGLCRLALLQRDFAAARKIATENWTKYPDFAFSQQMAAQVEFFSRNFAEAEKLYKELAAKDPNGGGSFYGAVSYRSALGRLRQAAEDEKGAQNIFSPELHKELDRLQSAPEDSGILYRVAAIESCLGMVESALQHLQAAVKAGWLDYRSLQLDPRFDQISNNPEFPKIIVHLRERITRLKRDSSN
jgi:serine/threonine protein kinase/tetratricopeptide (TPR) repeat protein